MTEINQKILDLIKTGASANEIVNETGLSNRQLFYRLSMLELKGYKFLKKYYYNGEILYNFNQTVNDPKENIIYTNHSDTEFVALIMSDLHLTSEFETLKYLNEAYEMCTKEGIHIVLNAGDLMDGSIGYSKKKFDCFDYQIDYVIKNMPFDPNILTFAIFGNHDFDSIKKSGQDLLEALKSRRHDIVPLGYGVGNIKIKNDEIYLKHPQTPVSNECGTIKNKVVIYGHTHKMLSNYGSDSSVINYYVPSLSDIPPLSDYPTLPGIVKATFQLKGGYFTKVTFEQFIFKDKMYKVGEVCHALGEGKDLSSKIILNEDSRSFKQLTKRR